MSRLTWEEAHGPIPEGLDVLHKCDNPPCRTLEHLFLGTNADNVADREAKGRNRPPRGEVHYRARLKEDDVRTIRTDPRLHRQIAKDFGISKTLVSHIKTRRAWAHI